MTGSLRPDQDMNRTLDPSRTSWLESANSPSTDFPIQNLPFGVFRRVGTGGPGTIGVAIGDQVLDVGGCQREGLLEGLPECVERACLEPALNALMSRPRVEVTALRERVSDLLAAGSVQPLRRERVSRLLAARGEAQMLLPCAIGDYTDFYASIDHATNVGRLFRPDNPLLPNYKWVPIGYHGRASSIVVSGTAVRRPIGQVRPQGAGQPHLAASARLDYELEVGCFVGPGNELGQGIPIEDAPGHIFGFCLVNDWSARDIQQWEYQPLGPFLAKSFATTISPWVVTLDALEPFRVPAAARPDGDPQPLPYLDSAGNRDRGGIDLKLAVGCADGQDARNRPPGVLGDRVRVRADVLDVRADGRAPRRQRVQPAPGRPHRERHGVRSFRARARLPPGAEFGRHDASPP